jgi:hypothetical protein
VEFRKDNLKSKIAYKWTGLSDCPFVNKRFLDEYRSITSTGWYRAMFKIMLSIASNAMHKGYPISAQQIGALCRELDSTTGNWYAERNMDDEAERAIAFAIKNI